MVRGIEHHHQQRAEFSRLVAADRVGGDETVKEISASAGERAALAERFGWVSMQRLTAKVRLRRLKRDLIRVSGRYEAELEQPCVVTLEPVPAHVDEEFSQLYAEDGGLDEEDGAVIIAPTEEEPPEPVVAGEIDIGEAVVQQLAVALDPYPRAPGAALPEVLTGSDGSRDEAADERAGPFAALAELTRARHKGR